MVYRWTVAGLVLAALAEGLATAHAQDGAQPMDLGRFVIAQISSGSPADIRAQLSFQVLISVPQAEWDSARSFLPTYRDIVIRTAYGYAAYVARNGVDSSPDRLANIIATRIGDDPAIPAPVFITLPNFQVVRPPAQDGAPRAPR